MRLTFKVLFYLKRNAPKKNGLVPVMCRIGKRRYQGNHQKRYTARLRGL